MASSSTIRPTEFNPFFSQLLDIKGQLNKASNDSKKQIFKEKLQPLLKEIFHSYLDPELSDLHYLITPNFNDESTLMYLTSKIDRIISSLKNISSLNLGSNSSYSAPSFSASLEGQNYFSTSNIQILSETSSKSSQMAFDSFAEKEFNPFSSLLLDIRGQLNEASNDSKKQIFKEKCNHY